MAIGTTTPSNPCGKARAYWPMGRTSNMTHSKANRQGGMRSWSRLCSPIRGLWAGTSGSCAEALIKKPYCAGPVEKRAVLLCSGKLRLGVIQQLFGLSLVEMLHDSHWILLSADREGFIPLTFTATQELTVRDGHRPSSEGPRGSLPRSQEPVLSCDDSADLAARSQDTPGCPHCVDGAV
ncbi:WD repeat and coiled-coil-containing protein isoform X3 [Cavia porcellus]|uniref:WD repeat and coiled-coil-containing protein isoform X3 n=1 Tax=Cavia porcellus TaxID=10141 RepID=UPI000C87AE10|nr:WD repeat and coiled-coil-containing protein isoform X2 [Cavia porcellus]